MTTFTAPAVPIEHPLYREMQVRASSADDSTRTCEAIITSETPVAVLDEHWNIVDEVLLADGGSFASTVPLLNSHDRSTVDAVLGSVRNIRRDGTAWVATLFFDSGPDGQRAFAKVKAGHLTDVSLGYVRSEITVINPNQSAVVKGRTFKAGARKLVVATKWLAREVFLVPIGADEVSKVRSAPVPYAHTQPRHVNMNQDRRAIAASLQIRNGMNPIDASAPDERRREQQMDCEHGDRYAGASLIEICREVLRLENIPEPPRGLGYESELLGRAFSTASLAEIFTDVVSAAFWEGWNETIDTTEGWCTEGPMSSFKVHDRHMLSGTGRLDKLPRGGTAKHAEMSLTTESFRAARYAKQAKIDEQDVFDDNMAALSTIPRALGEGAKQLRPDLVYAILLANAALSDTVALFDAGHANDAASALDATSLGAGVAAMGDQRAEDGRNANIRAAFLIVNQSLKIPSGVLLQSLRLPANEDLILRSDSRLGTAGVVDPDSGTLYAGSGTTWFLSARAGRTVEVGYVNNKRVPTIRQFMMQHGRWGIGWDINFDIGAKAVDYRCLYRGNV